MDLGPLRALVTRLNFQVHNSVPATVTVPDGDPVTTRIHWFTPTTDDYPTGFDVRRADRKRLMGILTEDVPTVPRGTIVEAPEKSGGESLRWRVDATDKVEVEHVRVLVIPAPEF